MIIELLDKELRKSILDADEIYIASGLISADGALKLVEDLKDNSNAEWGNVHIIVGIDMPTPVESLKVLRDLGKECDADVKYYAKKGCFFHPKVYLFKESKKYVAYVGSANYTSAGLGKNVELTAKITDQKDCKGVLKWFGKIIRESKYIADSMLVRYAKVRRRNLQMENMDSFKIAEVQYISTELKSLLKRCRLNEKMYRRFCDERDESLSNLVNYIDVKNDFKHFNVKAFCQEGALGWIIPVNTPGLEREKNNGRLANLCKMLHNDKISLVDRVDMAMNDSKYKVERAGINVVSKILTILYPKKCFLWNTESIKLFGELGNKLPRGLSIGEKYKYYCDYYAKIIKELDIENFAVLDRMLYYLDKKG